MKNNPFLTWAPPGHYYSPIPNPQSDQSQLVLHHHPQTFLGIKLNPKQQLRFLSQLKPIIRHLPFDLNQQVSRRYYYQNSYFNYIDGSVLSSLVQLIRPKQIIEIGSGFSTLCLLDTFDLLTNYHPKLTCIEPDPVRLLPNLQPKDSKKIKLITSDVCQIPTSVFTKLGPNDILFIDSSHVVKLGSEVNHLIFNILPLIKPGVYVHIHDILANFEYLPEWVDEGRAFSEAYLVRAFLQFNSNFEIRLFNSYLGYHYPQQMARVFKLFNQFSRTGGSLWLQKIK